MSMTVDSSHERTISDAKIIALADYLSTDFNSPLIPVKLIAEERDANVVFTTFEGYPDVAGLCDFDNALLLVNSEETLEEKVFTIAHELGHWELHREFFDPESDKYRPDLEYEVLMRDHSILPGQSALEDEANLFARHLLVPTRLFRRVTHLSNERLAKMFLVSVGLIAQRRAELAAD